LYKKAFYKLEMRSVKRGICRLLHSLVHNERTVPTIIAGCTAHERNSHISTSGLKSDVTIVFLGSDFLYDAIFIYRLQSVWRKGHHFSRSAYLYIFLRI